MTGLLNQQLLPLQAPLSYFFALWALLLFATPVFVSVSGYRVDFFKRVLERLLFSNSVSAALKFQIQPVLFSRLARPLAK